MRLILMAFVPCWPAAPSRSATPRCRRAEAEKIKAALDALGCSGGKMETETERSSVFDIDDAKCRDGQFDIKLDKDFKLRRDDPRRAGARASSVELKSPDPFAFHAAVIGRHCAQITLNATTK